MKKKVYLALGILALIIISIFILLKKERVYEKNLFYMDTYINIKIYTPKQEKELTEILDGIDYLYSYYHKLSDYYNEYDGVKNVYYLNEILKDNEEVQIDPLLAKMIKYGLSFYDKTDGYFNIALGNVTKIWHDYREEGASVPSISLLKESGSIDPKDIYLKDDLYKKTNQVKLDLGGLAKGYATEQVGKFLEENNLKKYIINAGGNVKVGKAYDQDLYQIGLEDPTSKTDIYKVINVQNKSIVTSGNYQRYYEVDGVRYSHIINPKTLYPDSNLYSLTVITDDSAYADVMSTYLYLLNEEERNKVLEQEDIDVIWYTLDGEIKSSQGFNYE